MPRTLPKMQCISRGLNTPTGTVGKNLSAEKLLQSFCSLQIDNYHSRQHACFACEGRCLAYSELLLFNTCALYFLTNKTSAQARARYFSQTLKMLRDGYPTSLSDLLKSERKWLDAQPTVKCTKQRCSRLCTLKLLHNRTNFRVHISASSELSLHKTCIEISEVQEVSIFKSPERRQQYMLQAADLHKCALRRPSVFLSTQVPRFAASYFLPAKCS
ncbi:hypothetical protein P3T76_014047 [Phytophthora citrophthora]|uniref:Uncharacterized protein n=1 Tax=Phytophthora citrophthora TaxID=4793 RepID=A0AAD9G1K2_9STRA|nr:hypothetical protein P3T76_014047 [Phytophthora citrophthora]